MTERVEKRGSEFYSVYSVFGLFGVGIDFSVVRSGQNASPWSQLFFIFKCVPDSQAGHAGSSPVSRSILSITYTKLASCRNPLFEVTG